MQTVRSIEVSKRLIFFGLVVLFAFASCKRPCYTCTQYCSYCVNRTDSTIVFKICSNGTSKELEVDSLYHNFQDSGYVCNLLNTQTNVCDNKNSINSAVSYYEKEDYQCIAQ